MIKLVNVYTRTPIRTVTPVVHGECRNILMNTRDILKCICMRATVEEVFEDGSTITLTAENYNKDNTPTIPVSVCQDLNTISDEATYEEYSEEITEEPHTSKQNDTAGSGRKKNKKNKHRN